MLFSAVLASLSNPCKKIPHRPRDGNKEAIAAWLKSRIAQYLVENSCWLLQSRDLGMEGRRCFVVGSHGTSSLQGMLVLGVHARIAAVLPSLKSPFPVNSQQPIPVFG